LSEIVDVDGFAVKYTYEGVQESRYPSEIAGCVAYLAMLKYYFRREFLCRC
jgi:hypothetical protein